MPPLDDTRRALDVLPGLAWSHWTADDLTDISALLRAVEAADDPSERHSLAELQADFASQTYDMARDCLLARERGGEVVAVGRSICNDTDQAVRRALLMGAVRPDHRGQGVGRAVLAWEIEHARAWFRERYQPEHDLLRISVYADSKAEREHRLAERLGLEKVRFYAELTLRLTSTPVPVPNLPGVEIRPWDSATPEATLAVRNASFRDHWGSVERQLDGWLEQQRAAAFRPAWSHVAVDTASGEVVSFLMSCAYEQDWEPQGYTSGYIELLGTLREHRGRGIGRALISRAMRSYQDAGMDAAEIGVDSQNESGAFGLYTGLGFRETSGTVQLMREERLQPE